MLSPGAGTVVEVRRGGLAVVGEMPVAMGDFVRLGSAIGRVVGLRDEDFVVALTTGVSSMGDAAQVIDDPGLPAGSDWLGSTWREGAEGSHAPAPEAPRYTAPPTSAAWLETGWRALDTLAPIHDRSSLLLTAPAQNLNSAVLEAVAAHMREAAVVWVLPGATPQELARVERRLGEARGRTVLVTSSAEAPALAHLRTIDAAASLAVTLRRERDVLVLVSGLETLAREGKKLDAALGRARDRFGWSMRTGQRIAALTDRCAGGPGAVAVIATAVLDEPGLDDHLVPWFDDTRALTAPRTRGLLPGLTVTGLSASKLGSHLLPTEQRIEAGLLRSELVHLSRKRDLALVTQDPDLLEEQERREQLLATLDQPAC